MPGPQHLGRGALLRLASIAVLSAVPSTRAFQDGAAPAPVPIELRDPLPFEGSVKDPVFAILVGLLDSDGYGLLTHERLVRELRRRGAKTRLPFQNVAWVSRRALEPGVSGEVTLQFLGPFRAPVPYSILGYHPGDIRASPTCRLREWYLGGTVLGARGVRFDEVRLFSMLEGDLQVDIDAWLDLLAGEALDDTRVTGLAVLRRAQRRYGIAFGANKNGQARYGVFDFASDKVLVPPPPELKGVPGDLRLRALALRSAASKLIEERDVLLCAQGPLPPGLFERARRRRAEVREGGL